MNLVEDKVLKNGLATEMIRHRYKDLKTCGKIWQDEVHGITKYATPVGIVACILPTTNPTSTAIAKALFLAKTRNVGVVLPHPRAVQSTAAAVQVCHNAGVKAGAPPNWLQCVVGAPTVTASATNENNNKNDHPFMSQLELSDAVMKHEKTNLILATGGEGMIKGTRLVHLLREWQSRV